MAVQNLRQLVARSSPPRWPGFEPRSGNVEFPVDKEAQGQVSSKYFGFPCQAFHQLLHTRCHPSSSRVGTIGHLVASVTVDSVPLHPKEKKANVHKRFCLELLEMTRYCSLEYVSNQLHVVCWIRLSTRPSTHLPLPPPFPQSVAFLAT
jgi:hypothetical protein